MAKNKFYTVWNGRRPGVYSGWEACRKEVEGFNGARYKGFPTRELAESAFRDAPANYLTKDPGVPKKVICHDPLIGEPIPDSICVDAACSGNPGVLEYRGVDTMTGAEIFRKGPFPEGTVNLGEFLAVVHALAFLKQRGIDWPVYSDSRTALAWLRNKAVKTTLERNSRNTALFELVNRAVKWINTNNWPNRVLKWETDHWGEIPADFGRK
jgi:ribonuclease HI